MIIHCLLLLSSGDMQVLTDTRTHMLRWLCFLQWQIPQLETQTLGDHWRFLQVWMDLRGLEETITCIGVGLVMS